MTAVATTYAYPPPPPGYSVTGQPPQQQQTAYVTTPAVLLQHSAFTDVPMQTTCPNCHATVTTTVDYKIGSLAWIICLILAFAGCCLCSCIPFCIKSCKDAIHNCPNCHAVVGRYNRLS